MKKTKILLNGDILEFDDIKHQYTLKRDKEKIKLIPVTELIKKHGLSADYGMVNEDILQAKAERGKVIHEEMEKFIKTGEIGFTDELSNFIEQLNDKNIKPTQSEFMVNNDEIAGTVDIIGEINGETFIGDFKTTATLHRESVSWQLTLYAYLEGLDISKTKMICFHFPDNKTCKVVDITPITLTEIEELLRCERCCELYQKKTLELTEIEKEKVVTIQSELKALSDRKKELEKQEKELKEYLVAKMEETNIKSIDNDFFKITYVAPYETKRIDTDRLKEEQPEIVKQYSKTSITKASVKITLKKESY